MQKNSRKCELKKYITSKKFKASSRKQDIAFLPRGRINELLFFLTHEIDFGSLIHIRVKTTKKINIVLFICVS